jgi:hypothetical protein
VEVRGVWVAWKYCGVLGACRAGGVEVAAASVVTLVPE